MAKKNPKDWDPEAGQELENLALEMVGDGGFPNLFFVSEDGQVILATRLFKVAYDLWLEISRARDVECALEDRKKGIISSVEFSKDDPKRLVLLDMSHQFGFR